MESKSELRKKFWAWAGGWGLIIYATLYPMRPVCEFLKKTIPFELGINLFLLGTLSVIVVLFFLKYKVTDRLGYVLLLFVVCGYIYGLINIPYPEEKIHFLEYGIWAYLIFRALRLDYRARTAYWGAFVLTALFGWVDEGIQHLLPNRYYQTADVILNAVSGFLALVLVYVFQRDKNIRDDL